jgi:hypothetical protein
MAVFERDSRPLFGCFAHQLHSVFVAYPRYIKEEGAALLVRTLDANTTAHGFGEPAAQVEAEPGPADFACVSVVNAVELLKEVGYVFGGDADA